jgi:phosphoglycerate kinase
MTDIPTITDFDVADGFTYVSSVGGAFAEWPEGKTLPGIAALNGPATTA